MKTYEVHSSKGEFLGSFRVKASEVKERFAWYERHLDFKRPVLSIKARKSKSK